VAKARPLTAKQITGKLEPGRYADGGGLYLRVEPSGTRSWVLIYSRGGRGANKRSELGLGSARDVSLAEARETARRMRAAIRRGEDPRAARNPERAETFGEAADAYIEVMSPGWRNLKHVAQWRMTLGDAYCRALKARPVAEVGTADVLAVLSPIWSRVPETASRLRGRIEAVLDAAAARGVRSGENPARWKGHLAKLLPARRPSRRRICGAACPFGHREPRQLCASGVRDGNARDVIRGRLSAQRSALSAVMSVCRPFFTATNAPDAIKA
jgi:hypothetical protein